MLLAIKKNEIVIVVEVLEDLKMTLEWIVDSDIINSIAEIIILKPLV